MYTLGTTKVSGAHKVWYNNQFIPVSEHPNAVRTSDSRNLVCINTYLGAFTIEDEIFQNFTEHGVVSGVSSKILIELDSGAVPISQVKIGDTIDGDIVCGTVKHTINGKDVVHNLITKESLVSGKVEKY
jgi:hypothetical protein